MEKQSEENNNSSSRHSDGSLTTKSKLSIIKKIHIKPIPAAIIIIFLLICYGYGIYHWQHRKVENLSNQISILDKTIASNLQSSSSYNSPDTSITEALSYGKQPTTPSMQIDNGKAMVKSALYAIYFGNATYDDESVVVDLTINNNTDTTQSYDLSDFSIQTPNGQIFANPTTYTSNSSSTTAGQDQIDTIAPSGSAEEYLTFGPVVNADTAGKGYLLYTSSDASTSGTSTTSTSAQASSSTANTAQVNLVFKKPFN